MTISRGRGRMPRARPACVEAPSQLGFAHEVADLHRDARTGRAGPAARRGGHGALCRCRARRRLPGPCGCPGRRAGAWCSAAGRRRYGWRVFGFLQDFLRRFRHRRGRLQPHPAGLTAARELLPFRSGPGAALARSRSAVPTSPTNRRLIGGPAAMGPVPGSAAARPGGREHINEVRPCCRRCTPGGIYLGLCVCPAARACECRASGGILRRGHAAGPSPAAGG